LNAAETLSMLTAVLECWGSEAYRLTTPAIFEEHLQIGCADTQYETDMMEYIRSGAYYDCGWLYASELPSMDQFFAEAVCGNQNWSEAYGARKEALYEEIKRIAQMLISQ
jgi:hypothetical protein